MYENLIDEPETWVLPITMLSTFGVIKIIFLSTLVPTLNTVASCLPRVTSSYKKEPFTFNKQWPDVPNKVANN